MSLVTTVQLPVPQWRQLSCVLTAIDWLDLGLAARLNTTSKQALFAGARIGVQQAA